MKLGTILPIAVAVLAMAATPLAAGEDHVMKTPADIAYKDGPPSLPPGAQMTVLYGDPSKEGIFGMRLKLPDGYHIPPHFHSQPENVTVLSGMFHVGHGETADRASATALEPGGFFAMNPGTRHYAWAEGETVVQLNSQGPWTIEYVSKADDPRS